MSEIPKLDPVIIGQTYRFHFIYLFFLCHHLFPLFLPGENGAHLDLVANNGVLLSFPKREFS